MTNQDNLEMHSPKLVDENTSKIAELFPHCVTEAKDDNGNLKRVVDFDLLRQELSQSLVEGGQERYRLDWPGKRQAIHEANTPIAMTLRPAREESVNFDTTENLFIEGDNLEALKLLQESYLGQVKMIYIDPPYNTGNDFIYEDNFAEDTSDFLKRSEQVDEDGNRLITNTESNGRFHSDWLTMMYSRLKLARNLLRDDGLIFISIDNTEQANLRKICDELFGPNNFVDNIIWEKKFSPQNDAKYLSTSHDFILCYAKSINKCKIKLLPRTDEANSRYKNPDQDPRGPWASADLLRKDVQPSGLFTITTPNGTKYDPPSGRSWRVSEKKYLEMVKEDRIWFGEKGGNVPRIKRFLADVQDGIKATSLWKHNDVGHNQEASQELRKLFHGESYFDTPKPVRLINRMLYLASENDDIILDFFAGSSTTAQAVLEINLEDAGNRKFIMVQIDEPIDSKKQKSSYDYCISNNFKANISSLSKERIKLAGKKIIEGNKDKEGIEDLDIGFRVLKIDNTNMKEVYYTPDQYSQDLLDNLESHIKEDRTSEDLLFQVMLDWGVPLSLPIEVKKIQGHSVYYVGFNSLVACFDSLNTELVNEIAKDEPLKFVTSERAISHDQDKTNIKARFAQLSPDTDVRFI